MNPKGRLAITLTTILASTAAAAQPLRWERFVVPETGTSVDIPGPFSRLMLDDLRPDTANAS